MATPSLPPASAEGPRPPDERVEDTVTARMLAPHLLRAGVFLVVPTVLALGWLLLGWLAAMSSPSAGAEAVTSLLGTVALVLYLAGVAAVFVPAREPIAEWSRLVDGAGPAAPGLVADLPTAAARRCPAPARAQRAAGVPVLVLDQGSTRAVVLVRAYGADLHVGWTLWRSRSTATLLAHFLRDTFGGGPAGRAVAAQVRAGATRAFRDSVHALARDTADRAATAGATSTTRTSVGPASDLSPSAGPPASPTPAR